MLAAAVAAARWWPRRSALLCVRYVKIYFGMLTLAFGMVFYTFLLKFYRLTGGDEGMRGAAAPRCSGCDLDAMPQDRLPGRALLLLLRSGSWSWPPLVMWRIVHSPFGLCLRAIRDNPAKAEALGVSVTRYRWYAFVISAVFAAVGGALLGPPTGNVDPTLAYWTHSGNLVFMLLLGGFAHFFGPLLGAFVFIFLQDTVMSVRAVLAARLRRHPGRRRDLRPAAGSWGCLRRRAARPA